MTRVFVNGTFDILHMGHLKLLKRAKELGVVCVAIDTDDRVEELKGVGRPINNQWVRQEMLLALKYVDYCVMFNSDRSLLKTIQDWNPHFMVKGSDYIGKPIIGSDLVKNIIFVDVTNDSTTKIIDRISNR